MLAKESDASSLNVIVMLFQGSMLSLYAKGIINDTYQHFKARKADVKGHHGVGGESKYFFIHDFLNKAAGGVFGEWLCDPTTNSNVEKAAAYLRQILQQSDKESVIMLITYSRGYSVVSRLCSRFPQQKFISIMIDPVNPLAAKGDNDLPENVIANIVFVASDVMHQSLIYHLYIYKLFNVEWIDKVKMVHLPANHAEIGRRKAYIGCSINEAWKIYDFFTKEDCSTKGERLGNFFRLFFEATYYRAQGKIDSGVETKLMQATQILQKEFGRCYGDNLFANGKRIVTATEQVSVPAIKAILTMVTQNVAKAATKKTIWPFFSQKNVQQSEEFEPKFLRAML